MVAGSSLSTDNVHSLTDSGKYLLNMQLRTLQGECDVSSPRLPVRGWVRDVAIQVTHPSLPTLEVLPKIVVPPPETTLGGDREEEVTPEVRTYVHLPGTGGAPPRVVPLPPGTTHYTADGIFVPSAQPGAPPVWYPRPGTPGSTGAGDRNVRLQQEPPWSPRGVATNRPENQSPQSPWPEQAEQQKQQVENGGDLMICCHFHRRGSCDPPPRRGGTHKPCRWRFSGHTLEDWTSLTARYRASGKIVCCSKSRHGEPCRAHPAM